MKNKKPPRIGPREKAVALDLYYQGIQWKLIAIGLGVTENYICRVIHKELKEINNATERQFVQKVIQKPW